MRLSSVLPRHVHAALFIPDLCHAPRLAAVTRRQHGVCAVCAGIHDDWCRSVAQDDAIFAAGEPFPAAPDVTPYVFRPVAAADATS